MEGVWFEEVGRSGLRVRQRVNCERDLDLRLTERMSLDDYLRYLLRRKCRPESC